MVSDERLYGLMETEPTLLVFSFVKSVLENDTLPELPATDFKTASFELVIITMTESAA